MDFHSNLEFLCRVCAANTKGKNTVAECVYILKTPGMRDKLEKFLFLKVFENDALPKVLCKSCFRQVEATASLSKIAKHTQQVFREFLFSSLPKGTTTTMDANSSSSSSAEFTSSDFLSKNDTEKSQKANETAAVVSVPMSAVIGAQLKTTTPPAPPPPPPPLQTITSGAGNTTPRKDEVVVNVSVSDPLTRENQQKVISNSQRRHSIMIEAASLASFANLSSTLAQLSQKAASAGGGGSGGRKSSSPSRVLKYCPIAPKPLQSQQASQQPNQVTTFSSGGYVIESSKPSTCPGNTTLATTATESSEPTKKLPTLNAQMTSTVLPTANDNSILQQKRKNLVKALNNIKANSTGQVSLLKSSQQKQQTLLQQNQPQPATKSLLLEQNKKTIEDELPDHIIIAAPKNKQTMNKTKKPDDSNSNPKNSGANNVVVTEAPAPPAQTNATPPTTAKTSSFPEDILLGRVIRDPDLLKLILKALKWPVNKQNMDLQLQRLRNTRFTDIMSDTNLLQDTDLTQLLGPYLAPVLMAAQALQQQQQQQQQKLVLKNPPAATASKKPSTPMNKTLVSTFVSSKPGLVDPTVEEINKAIPYKLPPETSVQLVPALPEEIAASQKETTQSSFSSTNTSLKRTLSKEALKTSASSSAPSTKRQRKSNIQKHRDSIVISDEDEAEAKDEKAPKANSSRQRSNKSANNFEIDLSNPSFLAQLGLINGSSELANEALLALLQKQKMVLNKQQQNTNPHHPLPSPSQRRRHNSVSTFGGSAQSGSANEFDSLINIDDDIVLMEPVTTTQPTTITTTSQPTPTKPSPTIDLHNFVMPAQVQNSAPLITRPIIKRRKTVIHSSSQVEGKEAVITSALAATKVAEPTKKPETADNNGPLTTNQQNVGTTKGGNNLTSPTKTTAHDVVQTSVSLPSSTETSPSKQGCRNKQSKAALGQQLLEAIGLQKINPKAPALSLHYIPSSTTTQDTATTTTAANSNAKQSVQQIRSALKKSLKQAQEQQQLQMRSKEISSSTTVIQDADSTTKPAVTASSAINEIVIEHRSNQVTDDGSSSHIDVEEQIDKTTLLKSQKATTTMTTTTTTIANTVENKPSKAEAATKEQSAAAAATVLKKKLAAGRITERRCTLPSSMGRGRFSLNPKVEKEKSLSKLAEETKAAAAAAKKETEEKIKPETAEADRINISSSSITSTDKAQVKEEEETATPIPRRRGRKRATEIVDRSETPTVNSEKDKEKENEKEKDKEKDKSKSSDKTKDEQDETASNSGRPTRQSKTLSKYYKGPEKTETGRRSLPARSTRNRKYC